MSGFGEYEEHDALGLAHLIRSGQISAHEVLEAAISRIERRNPLLNAVITTTFDRAQQRISNGLPEGPFSGAPFVLKDLSHAWEGVPLTDGSRSLLDYVPSYTSTLVRRYEQAGLVILGKTNTPEFGLTPVTEPKVHGVCANPWNTGRTAGGSSGGSGAAVAAGMVPAASASDGGGSIRIPASQCGLFGLKPTRARTPSGPLQAEGWFGMSVGHALTRSVRDSAALLDATHGAEPGDPYAAPPVERPFIEEVGADPGRLRIGMLDGGILSDEIHPECRAAVSAAGTLLTDLGHDVSPLHLGLDRAAAVEAFLVLVAASTAASLDEIAALKGQRQPRAAEYELETWVLNLAGRKLDGRQVAAALSHVRMLGRSVATTMTEQGIDVIGTSTLASPPLTHHALSASTSQRRVLEALRRVPAKPALMAAFRQMAATVLAAIPNTPLFNLTGQPAMSVPLHWTPDNLPVGVQFAGHLGDEATLLRLAAQLEAARPWFARRPAMAQFSSSSTSL
jgi:Asp-tRNA(Asn)/Glu-tRNA(Gln) amidotransferase A subunit family amidase